jgi:alanine-glyoxylate transaminase/(R)-3-amino-2-methylpropionate-pyruvate transaminase
VYKTVRKHGGLCISDEVQTGFGRTGTNFWGFQNSGVIPDIGKIYLFMILFFFLVTTAKGIGNGAPLAAVITTPKIAQVLTQKVHFNTYGGNPISSAIGSAVLDVIKNEKIQQNAHEVGTHFFEQLGKLKVFFLNGRLIFLVEKT